MDTRMVQLSMKIMYGIEMQVPTGKLPGFYAQVIHKIGDHVNVFDRDELLFVVENEEERKKLAAILEKANMLGDIFPLLHLPSDASLTHLEDVGFVSSSESRYLYADRVALFRFADQAENEQDRWAALEQLNEHLLGSIPANKDASSCFILDQSLTDLAEGIVKAYGVSLHWLHQGEI